MLVGVFVVVNYEWRFTQIRTWFEGLMISQVMPFFMKNYESNECVMK